MNKPQMIVFDYGNTLLCEPNWNLERGFMALMKYITKNPANCTLDDLLKVAELVFGKNVESVRDIGCDISGQVRNRVLYEYLGIEFSLTPLECEIVFWNGISIGAIMPNADIMIDFINKNGIRSAVISNMLWSGEALAERLNRFLPNNKMKFIMTSSDYLFRKPNRMLFEIALQKAGLDPENVWYCGDNLTADVEGAASAGMLPVWYEDESIENPWRGQEKGVVPKCDCLHIHDWLELVTALKNSNLQK